MSQSLEFKIPEGYVFDKDNSTDEVIRFKPIKSNMKPLPIEEQIEVLEKVLHSPIIYGMCKKISGVARDLGYNITSRQVTNIIPIFNHNAYIEFYSKVETVQIRSDWGFWDSDTIFGNLRRRRFIRHLIKELKKQL